MKAIVVASPASSSRISSRPQFKNMFSSDKIAPLELVSTRLTAASGQAPRRAEPEVTSLNDHL
jgi:DNA-binding protein H-NS